MRTLRALAFLLALVAIAPLAHAQQTVIDNCAVVSADTTYTPGTTRPCTETPGGRIRVDATTTPAASATFPAPDNLVVQGSQTSAAVLFTQDTTSYESVIWSYSSAGSGNTVTAEVSTETTPVTWIPITTGRLDTSNAALATTHTVATNALYASGVGGRWFRLRISTYGSGTVTVNATFRKSGAPSFVKVAGVNQIAQEVVGNVASLATDSGSPLKMGCVNNTALPTATNGQRIDCQAGTRGSIHVELWSPNGTSNAIVGAFTDDAASGTEGLVTYNRNQVWDQSGGNWDRAIGAARTTDTGAVVPFSAPGLLCDDTSPTTTSENNIGPARGDCNSRAMLTAPGTTNSSIVTGTITRPSNTTTYTANTGWANATSGATYTTLTNVCRVAGGQVLIPQIDIHVDENPATKLQGILWLFDTVPSDAIEDNAAFNIPAADYANLTGNVEGFPFTLVNNQSTATHSGISLTGTTYHAKCASASRDMYAMVQVVNAYVPTASEILVTKIHALAAN
jgi:hypothetical protein